MMVRISTWFRRHIPLMAVNCHSDSQENWPLCKLLIANANTEYISEPLGYKPPFTPFGIHFSVVLSHIVGLKMRNVLTPCCTNFHMGHIAYSITVTCRDCVEPTIKCNEVHWWWQSKTEVITLKSVSIPFFILKSHKNGLVFEQASAISAWWLKIWAVPEPFHNAVAHWFVE